MTTTPQASDPVDANAATPVLEARDINKTFGNVLSLQGVTVKGYAGKVTCILGDNGAGKSTLIKTLAGFHQPTSGSLYVDGEPTVFSNPQDARNAGVAVVYQDLAMQPLMPIWRNFFLGREPEMGFGPFKVLDEKRAKRVCREELQRMGIDIRDPDQPVGTLSGGERQAVATARAVYFGARVLILDEPTSALGVRQAGIVLAHIQRARDEGHAVFLITHSPAHALMVGDYFTLLSRGRCIAQHAAGEVSEQELVHEMSGGDDLQRLREQLRSAKAS
ncbi:Monosaccharide ABC transporter ATP-binding protein, CUT2 family [metagenome]|uniref:Monosaccharide ABC transporter ATP-binding protein, CUT2 family n=1 Tax=metagenome TaxID=256318 RepID=A0A2P2C0F0_9ZZZZ